MRHSITLALAAVLFACGPAARHGYQIPIPDHQPQLVESVGMAPSGHDAVWAPWFRQDKDDVLGSFWFIVGKDGRACIVPGMVASWVSSNPSVLVGCDDWRIPRNSYGMRHSS